MWWINTNRPETSWHYSDGTRTKALCGAKCGSFFCVTKELNDRELFRKYPVCEKCLKLKERNDLQGFVTVL